jgi:predicted amidophosphoribosyltransferase
MPPNKVECPVCSEAMNREMVVCWTCFKETNRLDTVSSEARERWDKERFERMAADRREREVRI